MRDFGGWQLEIADRETNRRLAESKLRESIVLARAAGVPWSVIGEALGVTKQSAWEKYGERGQA